ncbi:MAG: AsmA family protein [Alphaproteobacteria bacterium]|nr:AsmA family protein [Alphaproteobacteria bacterium]
MRLRLVLLGVAGVVLLLVAGLGVALATLDFGRFAGPVAAQVERVTGRALAFEGEVSLRLLPRPSLSLRDVVLANAPGGSRPQMLRIGRLEAELELWPLVVQRRLHIVKLVARDADLLLERDAEGRGNWEMGAAAGAAAPAPEPAGKAPVVRSGAGGLPLVDTMELVNVAVGWRDARAGGEARSVLLRELRLSSRTGERISVAGSLVHREQVVGFTGEVDLPGGGGGAVVANASVTLPGAVVKLAGGIADARSGKGLDLSITGEAEPVSALEELLGVDLPSLRLELAARVQGDLDGEVRAAELKLKLGGSELSGTGAVDLSGARPKVTAELESARLDLVEAWPEAGAEKAPAEGGKAAEAVVAEKRVFSAEAFELGGLGVLDADVGLRVARLVLPGPAGKPVEVEQVVLRLVLADRDLALRPFGFVLTGSHVAGDARVNGRVAPPAMVLDVAAQQADLGRLLALSGVALPVTAKADLVLALRGAGASPRALAAALDGSASLVVGQGVLKGDFVEGLGLGALRQAVPQLQRLAESKLNCAIARFDVAKGVATARLIAADAGDLSLVGTGTVNLGTEALALDLAPRLKLAVGGISAGVTVPVQVRGSLLEPSVAVVGGRVAPRGNPLAGLGRIVLDPGASAANPCGGLGEVRPAAPAPHAPGLGDVLRLLPR